MRADLLGGPVDGLGEALAAVDAFDAALVAGLLRPQPDQSAGLFALADAVAGTPLGERVAEAADKAAAGAAGEEHFVALAGARTALLGAVHDALTAQVDAAVGRDRAAWPVLPAAEPHAPNLRAAARSWLADLARAGWRGLDHDLVSGSAQVVSAMLPDLRLRRLSGLLDGFAAELAASCPGAALERVPARRWADLWARALLLAHPDFEEPAAGDTVTGRLLPLGVDLHEHATAAQAQVHAVFEPSDGGPKRVVRASVSVPKPDTVVGMGVWQLLRPHLALLEAISVGRSMEITDMPLTAAGDLLWQTGQARMSDPADPFATARVALPEAVTPAVAPLDRHPVRLAEPAFLDGYTTETAEDGTLTLTLAGQRFGVNTDRLPPAGPLTTAHIAASGACIALLRWDAGQFSVQPLAVETTVKKKVVAIQGGAWAGGTTDAAGAKAEKAATEAVTVLRERAGRLLRK